MNGTSGFREVRSSSFRSPSYWLLSKQRLNLENVFGTFCSLTILSLSPQTSEQSQKVTDIFLCSVSPSSDGHESIHALGGASHAAQ